MDFVELLNHQHSRYKLQAERAYFSARGSDFEGKRKIVFVVFLVMDDSGRIRSPLTPSRRKSGSVIKRRQRRCASIQGSHACDWRISDTKRRCRGLLRYLAQ